jgi:hypothetical protein
MHYRGDLERMLRVRKLTPKLLQLKGHLAVLVYGVVVSGLVLGCVEAKFTLATDSRLPRWFVNPANLQRADITVTLQYLTPSRENDDALLEMRDSHGQLLSSVRGQACWHPVMENKKNKFGGFDSNSYPHYRYIKANGSIEVIEHRQMEPIFRISDDPDLKRAALAASTCDKG